MHPKVALSSAEDLLRTLHASFRASPVSGGSLKLGGFVMFSRGGRTVTLVGEEAKRYQTVSEQLFDSLPAPRRAVIGRRTVERFVQEAVIEAAALPHGAAANLFKPIVQSLAKRLAAPPISWVLDLPISGVKVHRSTVFGTLRLQPASPLAVRRVERRIAAYVNQTTNRPETKAALMAEFKRNISRSLEGHILGRIEVNAVDRESAERLARERARLTLDIMAFCDSLVTPATLVGTPAIDGVERPLALLAATTADTFFMPTEGARWETDLPKLLKHPQNGRLNRRISAMLKIGHATPETTRLLTAMGWAGRAAGHIRAEERFLSYVIALESLLLGKNEGEATFRLRLRCARLLGRTTEARRWIGQRVKTLYSLRSAIVHAGLRDVTVADVELARELALRAIVAVLVNRRLRRVTDLEAWLEAQSFA